MQLEVLNCIHSEDQSQDQQAPFPQGCAEVLENAADNSDVARGATEPCGADGCYPSSDS